MKKLIITLLFASAALVAAAQNDTVQSESEYTDLQRLSPDDYIGMQLPPLQVLLENARNTPQVDYYNKAVAIEERELKNVRRTWQHYFKLNGNYNYGSSLMYNESIESSTLQSWNTKVQNWWNIGAGVSIPIDEIFNRRNKIKQQKARIEQVEMDTERWLEEQRIKVIQQYTLAVQQLAILPSAAENMITAKAQYRMTEADFVNGKLDAQTLSRQKSIENVAIREYEQVRGTLNSALLTLEVLTQTPIITKLHPTTSSEESAKNK